MACGSVFAGNPEALGPIPKTKTNKKKVWKFENE